MKGSAHLVEELKLIEESVSLSQPEGRRIAIRSVFAAIEVLVAEISATLVDKLPPADETSHDERHRWFLEICALSNISYRIDDKGQVKRERPKTPLKNRALFALNMRARVAGVELAPKVKPVGTSFWTPRKLGTGSRIRRTSRISTFQCRNTKPSRRRCDGSFGATIVLAARNTTQHKLTEESDDGGKTDGSDHG